LKNKVNPFLRYPLYHSGGPILERLMVRLGRGYIKCLVCGEWAYIDQVGDNLRELCLCRNCKSTNRQRQMAYTAMHSVSPLSRQPIQSLKDFVKLKNFVVYNTEAAGPIHDALAGMDGYLCSYYYGDEHKSGELVNGIMHQDLQDLSFKDNSIDLILSSDVFEHVADPYQAHREVHRVLKKNGKHIFTVPFHQLEFADERRAVIEDGKLVHLEAPIYHGDPVSLHPEGALVFNIFSLEMLVKLGAIGFRTNMFLLRLPKHGILGSNAIVFEAIKL
jgi:SAM-dependent methyltransferase